MRELLAAYVARSNGGMISVHNFMATDDAFKTKVRPSEALMRKSYEIVQQVARTRFVWHSQEVHHLGAATRPPASGLTRPEDADARASKWNPDRPVPCWARE